MSHKMKKECPHCGHDTVEVLEAVSEIQSNTFSAQCTKCKAQGPIASSEPTALAFWELMRHLPTMPKMAKEYEALRAELELKNKELSTQLPQPHREGIYPWAIELEGVRRHANFWIEGGRKEERIYSAILCVEQGVNSWKNACYSYAERNYKLREKLSVDSLSNIIRTVDGEHKLGAGQLAEKISAAVLGK